MQRHGQKRRRGKHPPAKGRVFDRRRGQQRKAGQVGQPAQHQRRHKAQAQHKGQEHRRRAGQVEQRVLVGLGLLILGMAVERIGREGEQVAGKGLPGPHGGAGLLVLQGRVHVVLAAVAHADGHVPHLPVLVREHICPPAGQREGLVDVVFLVRRAVGREDDGVRHAQRQHQHKNQAVQRKSAPQRTAHAKEHHRQRQRRRQPVIQRQKAADLPVGHQQGQRAVDLGAVHSGVLLPQRGGGGVPHTQPAGALIMGRQRDGIAAALAAC